MTQKEETLLVKATALNQIRKIYQSYNYDNGVGLSSSNWDDTWPEQRDYKVKRIIDDLELNLKKIKQKHGHRIVQKS